MSDLDPLTPKSLDDPPSDSLVADETMALGRGAARRATCPAPTRPSTRRPTTAGSRCGAAWSRTRPRWSACSSSSSCVFIALFGPYITPYNPIETDMANALQAAERRSTGSAPTSWAWTSSAE